MSTESRQRKLQQLNNVREDDRQQPAEEEEQSIIKGLLPCIAGVGGVAIAIWLFVYLYVPPQNADGGTGIDLMCTRVNNLLELQAGLKSVKKWEELGQELGVDQDVLNHLQMQSGDERDKMKQVLRVWFESSPITCWEKIVRSLQKIEMQALAQQLSSKYIQSHG